MAKKSKSGTLNSDSVVVDFLTEFAKYLLAAGISNSKFSSLARVAYFQAASESAKFANKRLNQSAVAAMTGLTRVQVRAMSKGAGLGAQPDRLDQMVEGWLTDPRFLRSDYSARSLTISGRSPGFAELARKYGGDIPARAMLKEMVRSGRVRIKGRYAVLDSITRESVAQSRLRRLSSALTALSKSPISNGESKSSLRFVNYETEYSAASAKGRILLQRRSAQRLQEFLTELQVAGSAASIESPAAISQKRIFTRTKVVLISEEVDRTLIRKPLNASK
jgi:hypothetical protein